MDIRVGLSTNDLIKRLHPSVSLSCASKLLVKPLSPEGTAIGAIMEIAPEKLLTAQAHGSRLAISGLNLGRASAVRVSPAGGKADISVTSLLRAGVHPKYSGRFELAAVEGQVRVILETQLDTYVKGVLRSEMPDTYHIEAIKAQAVAARTYGLNPRLSHAAEGFNVCDSFLHCQAFYGTTFGITPRDEQAIDETKGRILVFADKPILAVFSANAGGHTENYENCFSDPVTNEFPPPAVPYLKGVAEGTLPAAFPSQEALRALWAEEHPHTADSWSSEFRWKSTFTQRDYEGHMHYVVEDMLADPQFGPFILKPKGGKFGHINSFEITRRGISGVAMSLTVHTSEGDWIINKELTIRSIFRSPELKVPRLHSARFVIEQERDRLGLLSKVTLLGLGYGHGVGLQQTGAEGWARLGRSWAQILEHYYPGTQISKV